jgi:predicted dehydrogenase
MKPIGVAIIGTGGIALANHIPGLRLCAQARLVALCDTDPAALHRASQASGVTTTFSDYLQCLQRDDVDAVIIATPNHVHPEIAIAAAQAGKHLLCEKPIALDLASAEQMLRAAEAAKVRHMTAFTYRFVPAMHYAAHLAASGALGRIYHFRAQRFQDWGDRAVGWRQIRHLAGTGELGDMLSHRIDYGHMMIGRVERLAADVRQFIPVRQGVASELDDWAAILTSFSCGATGVLESTKLASGRGEGHRGRDIVEINGEHGTVVCSTQRPHQVEIGKQGDADLHVEPVPREFLTWPGSPRDPYEGDPLATFRYDQACEFIDAIASGRECRPSLREGVKAQAVMEAALLAQREQRWVAMSQVGGYDRLW